MVLLSAMKVRFKKLNSDLSVNSEVSIKLSISKQNNWQFLRSLILRRIMKQLKYGQPKYRR
jgi:hypothetical protein